MTAKKKPAAKKVPAKAQPKPRKKRVAPAQDKLSAMGIEKVCEQIAECKPLHKIAAAAGVSKGVLITWLAGFPDQYARAREAQADKFAEEILEIADESDHDLVPTEQGLAVNHEAIARSRLRVDARKWLASKMAPKKYGEKIAVGGADDLPPVQQAHSLSDEALVAIAAQALRQ